MEALVPSILLGLSWLDAIRCDAEPEPPDSEARQATESRRREGWTVIGADGVRQTVLSKNTLEMLLDVLMSRTRDDAAAQ